ncbi:hypothetical protein RB614_31610 [Phytohabitans sp. ZYX-F-186]|uniref:Uncharacterized protein n=1 Tax=Phytohabitans maris TaxID=3071409 RepID=A0ABU0ZPX0_9ACTN|nr:hypothetical protein [Phytohabitans sp. ZYX-F-186]MDQ7909079.1 hypothetical protein [Phytohabitans sp. ZYX-F-186]
MTDNLFVNHGMTTYAEFVAAIARFDPVPLLGLLAGASARQEVEGISGATSPWSIPSIARESLAHGADGGVVPTEADLIELGRIHHNLHDPYVSEWQDGDGFDGLLVRAVYEQIPFRHAVEREHARSIALYDRDYEALPRSCAVLSQASWERGLGRPIGVVLRSAAVIRMIAARNSGWFDPSWLRRAVHAGTLEDAAVTSDDVKFVFNEFFVADYADHRRWAAEKRHEDARLRRLDFNPLVTHPFVRMPDGHCIAPSMHLVAKRLGPASLYAIGNELWPRPDKATKGATPFSGDAGVVLEAYVGELLARLNPTLLIPERSYPTRDGERMTADFTLGPARHHRRLRGQVRTGEPSEPPRLRRLSQGRV